MKKLIVLMGFCCTGMAMAQLPAGNNDDWKKTYRATAPRINDLIHTKLDAGFDYSKSYLNGKVWITLKPHFYPTDSLQLDAKGMNLHKVALIKAGSVVPLKYRYDGLFLDIALDKTYQNGEQYTVYIEYTAKPDEFKVNGSSAITDAKGLYFINPKGVEKDKPTQIWTQGETEATSVWVPTIDRPNQKTTQQFSLTVPAKYATLSNGKLTAQQRNNNGTRTDTWVMDLPHAPYLFFIGIGDYAVIKDSYKGKEVSYYVEKEYAPVARKIFGHTPEMMKFFSDRLGVEYPWAKYSQMVARDYVSGAMENTTATLHQESAQQDARALLDGNDWESTIAHELFHQWFGNLVTAESWSNLTVNESFANYSQLLWLEYKYGKDEAGFENYKEMRDYFLSGQQARDLVRFYYHDKEDMFDAVSYNKGGRVLHMLRNYTGDDAFFQSLNRYLTANRFGTGNAHKLRIAFEEVTGKDLNWFFNQWYFGNGHPKLDISYGYDTAAQTAKVMIRQIQSGEKLFKLPLAIDIYHGDKKTRHHVWAENKTDTFYFKVPAKPDQVNVDADKVLLADKKDNKPLAEFIHQYRHAGNYLDRREAIDYAAKNIADPAAYQLVADALKDPYFRIRSKALSSFGKAALAPATITRIEMIAKSDPNRTVRADAIDVLGGLKKEAYKPFFLQMVNDSSYSVAGSALEALAMIDTAAAFSEANRLTRLKTKGRLNTAVTDALIVFGDETSFEFVAGNFEKTPMGQTKFNMVTSFSDYVGKINNPEKFKKGIDLLVEFREDVPGSSRQMADNYINNTLLQSIIIKKEGTGAKELADYVRSKIPSNTK